MLYPLRKMTQTTHLIRLKLNNLVDKYITLKKITSKEINQQMVFANLSKEEINYIKKLLR